MGERSDSSRQALSALPAVHEIAAQLEASHQGTCSHPVAVAAARGAIEEHRGAVLAGNAVSCAAVVARARELLAELERSSLRRVINATGVIVHTNLGRAPLSAPARQALAGIGEGYSNLELELSRGTRGSRNSHVEGLLRELTGAQAAIVVNNGAASVLLAAAALAGAGRAIIVSRGQLVEIGGGFRIPEVIAQSGAQLIEVGTTNRTRLRDYERAIASAELPVGAILRVHSSNFRAIGFVEEVPIEALCELGLPVIDDTGSGVLADASGIPVLGGEPDLKRSMVAGAAIACSSADKLLGGPQAGLMVGTASAIAAAREHPLARALRIDKLSLAALEATLMLYRDPARARREVPVLAMLDVSQEVLLARAKRLVEGIGPGAAEVIEASARVGGGALPLLELEGPAVALLSQASPVLVARLLRESEPPVLGRLHEGHVLLDPRTIADKEIELVVGAARRAMALAQPE